jgi:hypothetical protein
LDIAQWAIPDKKSKELKSDVFHETGIVNRQPGHVNLFSGLLNDSTPLVYLYNSQYARGNYPSEVRYSSNLAALV